MAGTWDAHTGRLDSRDSVVVRGTSDGTAPVRADIEGRAGGCHDRTGSTRGAGRATCQVIRIVRPAEQQVAGGADPGQAAQGELGSVGLAEQDGSGLAHPAHHSRVFLRYVLLATDGCAGRNDSLGVQRVLDRNGHPVERAGEVTLRGSRIQRLGLGARTLEAVRDDGIELVVHGDLTIDEGVHGLEGRDLLRPDEAGNLCG